MADRRMFAKTIVMSDAFIDMAATARCLYFALGMYGDDDGFVNSPKSVMRQIGASDDDLKELIDKKFILMFDSGVAVIKHWRINNYLRNDRYKETTYIEEKQMLEVEKNGAYKMSGIPLVYQRYTNMGIPSIDKNSIDKDSIDKDIKPIGEVLSDLPTEENIAKYIKDCGFTVDPHKFFTYYSEREFPKDWKNAVNKWQQNAIKWHDEGLGKKAGYIQRDNTYDGFGTEYLKES